MGVNFLNFFLLKLKSFWDPRSQDHIFCRYVSKRTYKAFVSIFFMTTSNQTKSSIFWGTTPSDEVYETALHCPTSTAFVARSAKGIIGWFWFENQDGETEMVPLALLATDAVDFGQCRAISYTSYGGVVPHNMRLRNQGGMQGLP